MSRIRNLIREGISDHGECQDGTLLPLEYFIELKVADYIRDTFVEYIKDKSPTEFNLVELLIRVLD